MGRKKLKDKKSMKSMKSNNNKKNMKNKKNKWEKKNKRDMMNKKSKMSKKDHNNKKNRVMNSSHYGQPKAPYNSLDLSISSLSLSCLFFTTFSLFSSLFCGYFFYSSPHEHGDMIFILIKIFFTILFYE